MPDTSAVTLSRFEPDDGPGVISLILSIQRDEFGIPITLEQQPDLAAIPTFYQSGKGDFWVAKSGELIVGTVGLKDIGNAQAALRKMFVSVNFRGPQVAVAPRLLSLLLAEAQKRGITEIFLGTTDKFVAAHRFYEKHGFSEISKESLPNSFPAMPVDTKFYVFRFPG